ncbi:putative bifunctional diguanylate cyclase/phosphodiesterase [Kitasatospora sp. DSM 101779]|uniref:putative bifunctional diguanylate cyclase/phosphodiesterase n=1 Tax=Kitasatospora sp. DSM 101779 TaxID=2853165 RepID=UPI0021D9400E|nr:EAL domain-containing protein [Kitasatospora sp. DSM 101779]
MPVEPLLSCPTCAGPVGGSTARLLAALRASESRFRAAFADAGIGMALIDAGDRIIEANPAFAAMLGREPSDLARTHIHEIIEPEDTPRRLYRDLVHGRRDRLRVEKRLKHRDGRSVWSKVTLSLIRDGAGHPLYTLAMVEDVTEQRLLGDRLAYQALHDPLTRLPNRTLFFERLEAAFLAVGARTDRGRTEPGTGAAAGQVPSGSARPEGGGTTGGGLLTTAAAALNGMSGPPLNRVPGRAPNGAADRPANGTPNGTGPATGPATGKTAGSGTVKGTGAAGSANGSGTPGSANGSANGSAGGAGQGVANGAANSAANGAATGGAPGGVQTGGVHSGGVQTGGIQTGRVSAGKVQVGGVQAADGERHPRIGLCYLDLDGFAVINETLGHHVGDQLLVAVAGRLENGFARGDRQLVARLGGDEFAVLITDSEGSEQLTSLAGRLIKALEKPFEIGGHRLAVTASVGVVERPVEGTSPTDLLKDADSTLYWSKADGRARWTLYDPARGAHQLTRQLLSTALRPALERGEFIVEYQPLVGLSDGLVHGAEALVRWRHPRYGTLSPDRFIPLAEESGAIVPLGKWVLEESCRQARRWLAEFPDADTFVSVNLAARQIWDSDVVADVAEVLDRTGLPAGLLQLEITESALLGPGGRPIQALQALADMGIRIAIDDFGTGYSNLAYLSRLPVHVLKLDGTFVEAFRDAGTTGLPGGRSASPDPDGARARRTEADEQIVGAMVQLAHALGLTVTAEGIENAAQAERLRLTGCDTAQGWYFAKPGDAEIVADMLRECLPD